MKLQEEKAVKEVSYYPGCSLHGTAKEYDESIRGVSGLLDMRLHELENWTCCGASSAHCTDEGLAVALPARNLAIAEREERELLVPCVACYHRFKVAEKEAKNRPEGTGLSYRGKVPIRYALDFFSEKEVLQELRQKRVKPLTGLKVVCYYGCLPVRPPELTSVKDYENPEHMDRLVEVLGAEPVPWSYKTDCCGASLVMTRTDIVRKLVGRILSMALEAEADCIVTGCSMCQSNLDTRQEEIRKSAGERVQIPVLYFTELTGLALGHKDAKKWLNRHITSPLAVFRKKGLIG
jgi:heterodisulfide reductase subunit B2